MNSHYYFSENEIQKIINRFGENFYEKVLRDTEGCADRWSLTDLQFIPSYSANLIFKCNSESFGRSVLKIGNPSSREIAAEYNALLQYGGRGFCRVYEGDMEKGIILEECVEPGNTLREESSLDRRLSVFASLYKGLHIEPVNAEIHPTYIGWVTRITEYMSRRQDCRELYLHMKRANDICISVSSSYSQNMLLHGDFHHDNILLGRDGRYVIIDPKGVIGDPVFDIARFILNEFDGEITEESYKKISYIICTLERELNIPSCTLKQCLYVETAMAACWSVEDGATPEEYQGLIEKVDFAESVN